MSEEKQQNTQQPESQSAVVDPSMARLSAAFETSARRWELIVYPSLFAFIVLAAYGFFLIYRLAGDMHYLTESVDRNMSTMSNNFADVAVNLQQMTDNVRSMTVSLDSVNTKMSTLEPMLANIDSMDRSMKAMQVSTSSMTAGVHHMGNDMSKLNRNIGRPMGFMNTFMPW